ncbi:hypothetical protein GCM10010994_19700 [Chelatococcus reniformis]|uniref:AB hydrolase-1 domain-containing protein n=2 Tax=Chelatococcus reniformis TaxID=1494448 RepID=A0A916U7B4_9HYPH|nr:hypothetical protein GCM10010994_19700 [Chelatococcus reniformis]
MGLVDLGGVRLWTGRAGKGSPLLVITGTGADLRKPPTPLDFPLAGRFALLAYDQRGLGRSDKPAGPYSMADYAADAADLIEAVGWPRTHVMGISFGGMVAQELAIRRPELVHRLALCCSSPGGAGGSSYPLHELHDLQPLDRARRMVEIADTRRDGAWAAAHPEAFAQLVAAAAADPFGHEPGATAGRRWQLGARADHDAWERLGGIAAETLVCAGRYDGQAPPANQERLHARLLQAVLRFYEGGHGFLLQDPAAFEDIASFLDGGCGALAAPAGPRAPSAGGSA